jgi:hypothetical protein
LEIYQLNSKHLEDAIRGSSEKDPRLEKYDKRSIRAFVVGSVAALIIGLLSASFQIQKLKDNSMADKENTSQNAGKQNTNLKESVNGISNLNPNNTLKKSLDGITDLSPQATQQPAQSQDQSQNNTPNQSDSSESSSDSGNK